MSGYAIQALDASTWDAFADLAEKHNGVWGGCWCTWFHSRVGRPEGEKGRPWKEHLVREGKAHAALVFDGEAAVAWCQYGSPDELPRIYHRKEYEATRTQDPPDYRITCFFVDRDYRRKGVAAVALRGALDLIAKAGGGVVEGYPHDTQGKKVSSSFLYSATRSLFEEAGFTYDRPQGTKNCVMRTTVSPVQAARRARVGCRRRVRSSRDIPVHSRTLESHRQNSLLLSVVRRAPVTGSIAVRSLDLDPARLDQLANDVVRAALDWTHALDERSIRPDSTGSELLDLFRDVLPENGLRAEEAFALTELLENSRAQNGRFFGYVMGSAEPVGVLGDFLSAALNQNVTSWRSGPAATTIERALVERFAHELGCDGFSGSFCGGGSSANLMGLAMARESKSPANEVGARPATVYASTEVHMSIPKAVALLGLGRDNVRLVAVDERFRMKPDALRAAILEDSNSDATPMAVVASAGTVSTGAVDPLEEIAAIAREHDLYLHVDGAYGGLAALAAPDRIGPLGLADSVSLDLHKWLYQPIDCGLLLFRDRDLARRTFTHTDDYVAAFADDPLEAFMFFEESIELSRRFRALKVWLSVRFHGLGAYRASIREDLELAERLAQMIEDSDDLELLAPVELSAVCFRACQTSSANLDALNRSVLAAVNERGRVYISNATINGSFALRACITNHRTTTEDLDALIEEVRSVAVALTKD